MAEELRQLHENEGLFLTLTFDTFTARTREKFFDVNLYYLTSQYEYHHVCYGVHPILGRATANVLAARLECILFDTETDSKSGLPGLGLPAACLTSTVTDGGANLPATAAQLEVPNLHCAAHRLHLAVVAALKSGMAIKVSVELVVCASGFSYPLATSSRTNTSKCPPCYNRR